MMTIEQLGTYHTEDLARMLAGDNWGKFAGLSKVELGRLILSKRLESSPVVEPVAPVVKLVAPVKPVVPANKVAVPSPVRGGVTVPKEEDNKK